MEQKQPVTPTLLLALTPVVLTLIILGTQIFYFGVFEPHIPLAIGVAMASFVGIHLGLSWEEIRAGIFKVIHVALPSVSVLIVVGMIMLLGSGSSSLLPNTAVLAALKLGLWKHYFSCSSPVFFPVCFPCFLNLLKAFD